MNVQQRNVDGLAEDASLNRMSVPELARYVGLSQRATYVALKRGEIPSRKVGGRYLISRDVIRDWGRCAAA